MTTIAETNAAYLPADRMMARGPTILSNGELLALFMGGDSLDAAFSLLKQYGSLRALLATPLHELAALPGLDKDAACRLVAAMEFASRQLAEDLSRGESMHSPDTAKTYFATRLRERKHEVFAALFLDTRHRVIAYEEVFSGTVDGAEVHPRVMVQRALALNAAAMIVSHNHPSGEAEPSAADRAVTAQLKQALALVDVRLLDHIVVGDGPPVSLAARGWV